MDEDGLFSLADLPDELEATSSGDGPMQGVGPAPNLELQDWCQTCQSLRQEITKMKTDHTMNYSMLKEKIVQTDLLIRRYNAKCQESDNKSGLVDATNKKLENLQRECDSMASQLKSMLEEAQPMRKAKERLEKQKADLKEQLEALEGKLHAKEVTQQQLNIVRMEQAKKLDTLDSEHSSQKSKIQELETSLRRSETALKRAQDDVALKKKDLVQQRKVTKQDKKIIRRHELRIAHYEAILIKHGLNYAITSRAGRQSCESSIVSHDLSEDWEDCRSPAAAELTSLGSLDDMAKPATVAHPEPPDSEAEEDLERVFEEMGVTGSYADTLDSFLPALSPIPASPAPGPATVECDDGGTLGTHDSLQGMDDDYSQEDAESATSGSDLEDVAGLLDAKLLSSSPEKSPAIIRHGNKRRSPSKLLQRQLSMDQSSETALDDGCDGGVLLPPPRWLPSQTSTVVEADSESQSNSVDIEVAAFTVEKEESKGKLDAPKSAEIEEAPMSKAEEQMETKASKAEEQMDTKASKAEEQMETKASKTEEQMETKAPLGKQAVVSSLRLRPRVTRSLRSCGVKDDLEEDMLVRRQSQPVKYCRKRKSVESEKLSVVDPAAEGDKSTLYSKGDSVPSEVSELVVVESERTESGQFDGELESMWRKRKARSRSLSGSRSDAALTLRRSPRLRQPSESSVINSARTQTGDMQSNLQAIERISDSEHSQQVVVKPSAVIDNESKTIFHTEQTSMHMDNGEENTTVPEKPSSDVSNHGNQTSTEESFQKNCHDGRGDVSSPVEDTVIDNESPVQNSAESTFIDDKPIAKSNDESSNIMKSISHETITENAQDAVVALPHDSRKDSGVVLEDNVETDVCSGTANGNNTVLEDLAEANSAVCTPDSESKPSSKDMHESGTSRSSEKPPNVFLASVSGVQAAIKPSSRVSSSNHKAELPKQSSTGFDVLGFEDSSDFSSDEHSFSGMSPVRGGIHSRKHSSSRSPKSLSPVRFTLVDAIKEASNLGSIPSLETRTDVDIDEPPSDLLMATTDDVEQMITSPAKSENDDIYSSSACSPASLTWVEELPSPISPLSAGDESDSNPLEDSPEINMGEPMDCHAATGMAEPQANTVSDTVPSNEPVKDGNSILGNRLAVDQASMSSGVRDNQAVKQSSTRNQAAISGASGTQLTSEQPKNCSQVPKRRPSKNASLWSTVVLSRKDNSCDDSTLQSAGNLAPTTAKNKEPASHGQGAGIQRKSTSKNAKLWTTVAQNQESSESNLSCKTNPDSAQTSTASNSAAAKTECYLSSNPASKRKTRSKSEPGTVISNISKQPVSGQLAVNAKESGNQQSLINKSQSAPQDLEPGFDELSRSTLMIPKRRPRTRKQQSVPEQTSQETGEQRAPIPSRAGHKRSASETGQGAMSHGSKPKILKTQVPVVITNKEKKAIDLALHKLLMLDSALADDTAANFLQTKAKPQGIVDAICKHLLNAAPDPITAWYKRCERDDVDDRDPWLSKMEVKFVRLMQVYADGQDPQVDNNITELFLLTASTTLQTPRPASQGPMTSGVLALGKMIIALCRLQGNLERARIFVYDWVHNHINMFVGLLCSTVGVWRDILLKTPDCSPVITTLEHIVFKCLDGKKDKHKMMEAILRKVCGWERLGTCDDLASSLLSGLKSAAATKPSSLRDYEKALDLLASQEDWKWCNDRLVVGGLWPNLQQWSTRGDKAASSEPLTESTLRLLGLVMRHFPADGKAAVRRTIGALVGLLHSQNVPSSIQLAAVHSVVQLSPFDPVQTTNCLQSWILKKQPTGQEDMQLIQECLEFYK